MSDEPTPVLPIPWLKVEGYKNLDDLHLDPLKRINLITGRNNAGKTNVLEAIMLLLEYTTINAFYNINAYRYNYPKYNGKKPNSPELVSSFFGRLVKEKVSDEDFLERSTRVKDATFFKIEFCSDKLITHIISVNYPTGISSLYHRHGKLPEDKFRRLQPFEVQSANIKTRLESMVKEIGSTFKPKGKTEYVFVPTSFRLFDRNHELWQSETVKGSSKARRTISGALRILEDRIDFIEQYDVAGSKEFRVTYFDESINPVHQLADGFHKIFTIVLNAVSLRNGVLLIDEFENGLHWSVMEKVWRMVFLLADELNLQVFATTHSLDCVRMFEKVANTYSKENPTNETEKTDGIRDGAQILNLRLEEGKVIPRYYDEADMMSAYVHDLELRG